MNMVRLPASGQEKQQKSVFLQILRPQKIRIP